MSKNTKIEIRLTEEMKNALQKKAQQNNTTVSNLIRQEIEKLVNEEREKCEEKI